MVLRAVPTAVDVADESNGAAAPVEHGEAPAFDLAAYAKGLEVNLRTARERLRAADASVATIRSGAAELAREREAAIADLDERLRLSDEATQRLAAERDSLRSQIAVAADRDALAETLIALREAYGRMRRERADALTEVEALRGSVASIDVDLASARRECESAEARLVQMAEETATERALAAAGYVALVDDFANAVRTMARLTAAEIDAIQSSRTWRLKGIFARLFGRGRTTSAP